MDPLHILEKLNVSSLDFTFFDSFPFADRSVFIQNSEALNLYMLILFRCSKELQATGLHYILSIIESNLLNKHEASNSSLLTLLLKEYKSLFVRKSPENSLKSRVNSLIKALFQFKCTAEDIQLLLSYLDEADLDVKHQLLALVKDLLIMSDSLAKSEGTFICFDSQAAGLKKIDIPLTEKFSFPPEKGFSLALWVYSDMAESHENSLKIVSFMQNESDPVFDISFVKGFVKLTWKSDKGLQESLFSRFRVQKGQWYHLVFSQSKPAIYARSIKFYVTVGMLISLTNIFSLTWRQNLVRLIIVLTILAGKNCWQIISLTMTNYWPSQFWIRPIISLSETN
jgi:hypothetical protein